MQPANPPPCAWRNLRPPAHLLVHLPACLPVCSPAARVQVWDESIELHLPPPLPNERPLVIRVKLMSNVRLFPDRFIASGSQPLDDVLYGAGQHEVTVPLTNKNAKPAGHLHLGLMMERVAGAGEQIGERWWWWWCRGGC